MTVISDEFLTGGAVSLQPQSVGADTTFDDGFLIGEPIYLGITTVALPGGSSDYYIYTQSIPMGTWTIIHSFNRLPGVTVIGPDGFVIITDIEYQDNATVVLTFAQPTTGRALLL